MELTPLTPDQQSAAAALVAARRIDAVAPDYPRANAFVARAAAAIADAENLTHAHTIYNAPPAAHAATRFDQLRRARNANRYEATPVGLGQAERAKAVALALFAAARARGVGQ